MRTVLVTGAAGFLGSAFVRRLFLDEQDTRVIALDALTYAGDIDHIPMEIREDGRFEFWYGSVNDIDLVGDLVSRADAVVHFAAETHVARSLYSNRVFFETDVLGTQSVANAVLRWRDRVERFIHISSSEVYGDARYEPMDEEHPLNPTSPYAAAKAGGDRLVSSYASTYGLPAVILRPFNNYGPRQHLEKVIPRFVTSALRREAITVHGTGEACRDWVHVDDTARAVHGALVEPVGSVSGEVINIGTGRSVSVLEIAEMVIDATGASKELVTFMEDRLGQVIMHRAAGDKARKLLDFEPQIPFAEGLQHTIEWYATHVDWWERMLSLRRVPVRLQNGKTVWY